MLSNLENQIQCILLNDKTIQQKIEDGVFRCGIEKKKNNTLDECWIAETDSKLGSKLIHSSAMLK